MPKKTQKSNSPSGARCQNRIRLGQNQAQLGQNLNTIIEQTRKDLLKRKQQIRSFALAIKNPQKESMAIIAEIKLASPAHPYLGSKEHIISRVKQYENAGADAVSVITEKHFFKGDTSFIKIIKNAVSLPVLQKDFVIDEYQIVESKYLGADAILLIAKILDQKTLAKFVRFAQSLRIEPVVEIADKKDLQKAVKTSVKIIAANARNLDTFKVNADEACLLLKQIPDKFTKLGFSGICSKREVEMYKQAGVQGILVGTALMKAADIKQFILSLRKA